MEYVTDWEYERKQECLKLAITIVSIDGQSANKKPATLARDVTEVARELEHYYADKDIERRLVWRGNLVTARGNLIALYEGDMSSCATYQAQGDVEQLYSTGGGLFVATADGRVYEFDGNSWLPTVYSGEHKG